ncbi:MAG: hypothetical protein Q8R97_12565 [Brevundimonas sp.]|nr:hypothetical protein [Brevundimonas sp.]
MTTPLVVRTLAPWAPAATPQLALAVAKRALLDIGICEIPPGSNRSGRIDEYLQAVGSPLASFWCAAAVAAWFREAGAKTPPSSAGSCDVWMGWAKLRGLWQATPAIGSAVVYGKPTDATHIGVVVRVTPLLLSVEGNTSFDGFSRNGVAVDLKFVRTERVLGYVCPEAA